MADAPAWGRWAAPGAVMAWVLLWTGLSVWGLQPPSPRGVDAPPDTFSAGRARGILDTLLDGVGPHPVGTPAARVVEGRIRDHLRGLGLTPRVQEALVCAGSRCARVRNVIVRLPGRVPQAPPVVVNAHYDSVPAGPGAGDCGAGVAAALELARLLRDHPVRTPVVLLFNEGEEAGLFGIRAWLREGPGPVAAVVNLEARGTGGRAHLFETRGAMGALTRAYAAQATSPSVSALYVAIYRLLPNATDVSLLEGTGIPAVNFAFLEGGMRYHTPLDDRAHLDTRSLQHLGDGALAAVRGLSAADPATLREGPDDVVFDILGTVVVRWPAGWASGLAVLAGVLAVVGAGLTVAGSGGAGLGRRLGGLAATMGVSFALPVSAAVALAGLDAGLHALGASFHGVPWPLRLSAWSVPVALALLGGAALHRVPAPCRVAGVALVVAALHGALVGLLPGASYLLTLPGLLLGGAAVGVGGAARAERAVPGPVLAALPLGGLLLAHVAVGLEGALGLWAFAVGPVVALALLTALPLAGEAPLGATLRLAGPLLVASLALPLPGLVLPPHAPHRPQALRLVHVQDPAGAWWQGQAVTFPRPVPLPEPWRARREGLPAAPLHLAPTLDRAPRWERAGAVVDRVTRTGGLLRFRLRAPPEAFEVGVVAPGAARVWLDGIPARGPKVHFAGHPGPEGVTVRIAGATGPVHAFIRTPGLPPGAPPLPKGWVPGHDGVSSLLLAPVPAPAPDDAGPDQPVRAP